MGLTDINNSVPVWLYPTLSLPVFLSSFSTHFLHFISCLYMSPNSLSPPSFLLLPRRYLPVSLSWTEQMFLQLMQPAVSCTWEKPIRPDPTRIMHWQPSDSGDSVTCLGKSTAPPQHPYSKSCDPTNPSVPPCPTFEMASRGRTALKQSSWFPVLTAALRNDGVWGSGDIVPSVLNLDTKRVVRFKPLSL